MEYFKQEIHELVLIRGEIENLYESEEVKNLKRDVVFLLFKLTKSQNINKEQFILMKNDVDKKMVKIWDTLHKIRVRQKKGSELEK